MYLSHFGLNEPPFRITPDTGFFFAGANRGATLEALQYAILHEEGIVKVSGEVGSGKTMLCRVLIERLPKSVEIIYLANPSLARDEILLAIADELGMNPDLALSPGTRLLKALHEKLISLYSAGRRVVVLIDEAHAMPRETLEEIRLLSNLESRHSKLLQLVLFGQPELDAHLDSPEMRPLKERITHSFHLEPLIRTDIEGYIEFRLRAAGYRGPNPFAAGALRLIADASQGLTRRINILCDKSLLAAFASNTHAVTEREARRAINDSSFSKLPGKINRVTLAVAGAAAGLLAGLLIAWAILHGQAIWSAAPSNPVAEVARSQIQASSEPDAGNENSGAQAPTTDGGDSVVDHSARAVNDATDVQAAEGGSNPIDPAGPGQYANMKTRVPVERGALTGTPSESSFRASEADRPAGNLSATPGVASAGADPRSNVMRTSSVSESPPGGASSSNRDQQLKLSAELRGPWESPVPPPTGKIVGQRFIATQQFFKNGPLDHFSIQLMVAKQTELAQMEDFLQKASEVVGTDELYVYGVRINGEQNYRVSYGNYVGLAELREAMKTLPNLFLVQQPFPRSFDRMRRHNSQ